jgi:hypothetical protein
MNLFGRLRGMSVVGFVALSVSLGCGGPQQPDPQTSGTPPVSTGAPAESAAPAPSAAPAAGAEKPAAATDTVGWHAMSHEQKMSHMKKVVMPKMSALFQGFNAGEFKDMNCTTCHGPGAKQGKFDMPTASIPKLNPADKFAKHMGKTAEMTKFMMTKVVPEMAALQGEAPYDPATQKGFGCFDCHMMEK